ncbi:MAG TPA: hypothetical protein VLI92_02175 [Candidatus Saccharimonadales bacterium]|nr:hypothetical protein [Candidatus Saccharimonadales bacterium]
MSTVVTGLYESVQDVNTTLEDLNKKGYSTDKVSLITRKDMVERNFDVKNALSDGVQTGLVAGSVVGGIVGLLVGLGAITLPGIGAIFVAGPLATALGLTGAAGLTASGAVTGALAGGILGALKEIGIDEVEAKVIENKIRKGQTFLMVSPVNGDDNEVKNVLKSHKATDIMSMQLNLTM